MRLEHEVLVKITGRHRSRDQVAWFLQHLGVNVPCDRKGPIITQATYEALVARACGLRPDLPPSGTVAADRPKLHLRAVRG